jgi:hypothetical protein
MSGFQTLALLEHVGVFLCACECVREWCVCDSGVCVCMCVFSVCVVPSMHKGGNKNTAYFQCFFIARRFSCRDPEAEAEAAFLFFR